MNNLIICIGEVLWDALPQGLFLGGAPFNVAAHLKMQSLDSIMVSRIGNDLLGKQVIKRMHQLELTSEFIQVDKIHNTGMVDVSLDVNGNASYEILAPSAWDFIEFTPELDVLKKEAGVVVFGTLAQRNEKTRSAIRQLCNADILKVYDVNLRPPFDNPKNVRESLFLADIVKMNEDELKILSGWFDFPSDSIEAVNDLSDYFGCRIVCITRGINGAGMLFNKEWFEHPGFRVDVSDTVGAGDAFLSGFLNYSLAKREPVDILKYANAIGAYAASKYGATPKLDFIAINSMKEE